MIKLNGTIIEFFDDMVIVDVGGVGYGVYTANIETYSIGNQIIFYIYEIIKENSVELLGLCTKEEYLLAKELLKIKGLGIKILLNILNTYDYKKIIEIINSSQIELLENVAGIGNKLAEKILFHTKMNFQPSSIKNTSSNQLKSLKIILNKIGFSNELINAKISKINTNKKIDDQVADFIQMVGN